MSYRIEYDPAVEGHLARLTARDEALVLDAIVLQLAHQPTVATRNRKRLRPNPHAPWELRVGALRVYYEVTEEPEKLVTVRAVGIKGQKPVDDRGRGDRPVMRLVEMAEAPAALRNWVTKARKAPVILTVDGRPAVALTPLRDGDWERLALAVHPTFRRILEESRQRCKPREGISTAEMRRRLKQRRLTEASSGRRRAPRPAQRSRPSKRG